MNDGKTRHVVVNTDETQAVRRNRSWMIWVPGSALVLAGWFLTSTITTTADAAPKGKYDAPTVTCIGSTQHTLFLSVCAGPSGAPAGFSIQWVKHSDFAALTCGASGQDALWPPSDGAALCKASFSGTPRCSRYNLGPNECVTVEIGNLLDAECGVGPSGCGAAELRCGTEYVFRAFAHANSSKMRSPFTENVCCSTETCIIGGGCTRTQGYWKTHACDWPAPFVPGDPVDPDTSTQCGVLGNNGNSLCACDSVNTIPIGSIDYNQCELLCAFVRNPQGGNALVILAHQLLAAELNVLNGASDAGTISDPLNPGNPYNGQTVADLIAAGNTLIDGSNILTGFSTSQSMKDVAALLDLYNNGDGGVGHCQ